LPFLFSALLVVLSIKNKQKKKISFSIFFSLLYARMAAFCQLGVTFDYFQRLLRDFRV